LRFGEDDDPVGTIAASARKFSSIAFIKSDIAGNALPLDFLLLLAFARMEGARPLVFFVAMGNL
jgi:hypothetical protein